MSRRYARHSCSDPQCSACNSAAEWAEIERDYPEAMSAGEERALDNDYERHLDQMGSR